MINLPKINNIQRRTRQVIKMLGINSTDNYSDGELSSCDHIGTSRYPYIHTVDQTETMLMIWPLIQITSFGNEMLWINDKGNAFFGLPNRGTLDAPIRRPHFQVTSAGELDTGITRSFAVVNSHLVMFPDMKWLDITKYDPAQFDPTLPWDETQFCDGLKFTKMGRECLYKWGTGGVKFTNGTFTIGSTKYTGCAVMFPFTAEEDAGKAATEILKKVSVGDTVGIAGTIDTSDDGIGLKVLAVNVTSETDEDEETTYYARVILTNRDGKKRNSFKQTGTIPTDTTDINFRTVQISTFAADMNNIIPKMDFVCSKDNRIYGCSNEDKTIYVSALGQPNVYYTFEGNASDPYSVAVASAEDFTGCLALDGCVAFFKQHTIHKLLGSYPAEYTLYTYHEEGVAEDMGGSLCVVDGNAFYIGEHGLYQFNGSYATIVSQSLTGGKIQNPCSMYNGQTYYLGCTFNGKTALFGYDTRYKIWFQQSSRDCYALVHTGNEDYAAFRKESDDGKDELYQLNTGLNLNADDEWHIEFKPITERITGSYNSTSELFEKKRYTRLFFRFRMARDGEVTFYIREHGTDEMEDADGAEEYKEVAHFSGGSREYRYEVHTVYLLCPRTDRFQIRIEGRGAFTLMSYEREYQQKQSMR